MGKKASNSICLLDISNTPGNMTAALPTRWPYEWRNSAVTFIDYQPTGSEAVTVADYAATPMSGVGPCIYHRLPGLLAEPEEAPLMEQALLHELAVAKRLSGKDRAAEITSYGVDLRSPNVYIASTAMCYLTGIFGNYANDADKYRQWLASVSPPQGEGAASVPCPPPDSDPDKRAYLVNSQTVKKITQLITDAIRTAPLCKQSVLTYSLIDCAEVFVQLPDPGSSGSIAYGLLCSLVDNAHSAASVLGLREALTTAMFMRIGQVNGSVIDYSSIFDRYEKRFGSGEKGK
jgi:hypothetical protein